MGRASSSKKVARAAGTGGGRTAGANRPWGYIGVIALIVIVGLALTVTSRSRYQNQLTAATNNAASVPPLVGGAPWHEGYLVDICGSEQKPLVSTSNPQGYTTTGDGVVRIAPKTKAVAGKNATLGVLAQAIGIHLALSSIQLPGGRRYTNGDNCGSLAARLYVKQYAYPGAVGTLSSTDPTAVPLADDGLVTIAFVPPSKKGSIPEPPKSVQTALTKAVTPVTTTTTTGAAGSATTIPPSSSTTAAPTTTAGRSPSTTSKG